MTLAYGKALKDEVIARIAAKHNATPAQVILAWAMGEGYAVIPSSTKRDNLASNLKALDLQLDDEDRQAIAALDLQRSAGEPGRSGAAVGLITRYRYAVRPAAREGITTAPSGSCFTWSLRKSINALMRVLTARSL